MKFFPVSFTQSIFNKRFKMLGGKIRRRGLVVVISDLFFDAEVLRKTLRQLRHKRNEVVLFHVLDNDELTFPFQGNTLFRGLEVDAELLTEPPALRKSYLEALAAFLKRVRRMCAADGIDYVLLNTGDHLDAGLSRYLASRQRALHTFSGR